MSVRIMTVCTGNICRSPYVQLALGHALESVRPGAFEVVSAGTQALIGNPVEPGSASILDAKGITHDHFAARQISERMLDDIDIVLPLEVSHRKIVLSYSPRHLKRAYTVKELARLLDSAHEREPWTQRLAGLTTPEERWAALPSHLARERGLSRAPEGADDIDDPYRQPQEVFDRMAAEVDAAVERIVAFERQFD
ncbi:low molecular weight phosphatase family protein [Janibacter sp. YB324]|uniref:arsenate reductase/protein-tyrosine-phosphatase family protein n=1 Tax=Janibacter sp. YB324 TaxID=2761047 RepID=UPI001628D2C6|nr:low molecular weight phosphatase family protein [Janibacter sp. YB324]QNF94963.1 low molecular weight phosphatase family protein [Janibacter sp. YB324]